MAPEAAPERIRAVVAEVFAGEEFNSRPANGILEFLVRWLNEILLWLGSLHAVSPALYWLLLIGCLALLAGLVAHIVWTVRSVFVFKEAVLRTADHRERIRLSREFAADADRLSAAGQFTEAIRCLFLSLVYRFDESGRIGFRKGFTNREYLHLFEKEHGMREDLEFFVVTLDEYWYGQRPADRDQFDRCRRLFDKWS